MVRRVTLADLIAVVLAFCAESYPGEPPESVSIRLKGRSRPAVFPVPHNGRPAECEGVAAGVAPVKSPGCAAAVLRALVRAGTPLTEPAIADALEAAGEEYSESALLKTLAQLVALNILANPPKTKPRGYRFAGDEV
jgi:hypothetical protein